ncbi:MAG: PDZ domain-containing protein [Lentisphaerae bacterium]|nr:MAG: PDZ domain-containing protein [Lentisphaerota bacterium]
MLGISRLSLFLWSLFLVCAGGQRLWSGDMGALLEDERNTISIFEKNARSVVYITNKALRRDFFTLDVMAIPQGTGSGFVWDKKGHIVTNFHVIQGAAIISVTLADRTTWEAKVVGTAPNKDLAVLKIDAPAVKLHPLVPGDSSTLKVGQKVLAIGNPFGLDQTLTVGIVSALGREIKSVTNRTIHNVIQTDAAINPGNSGGPLLDSRGRLIGINTAIYSPTGTNAGIGFAVPVNTIIRIVPQLIRYGRVIRPSLGINVINEAIAKRLGIPGIIIHSVIPGSGAAKAGLRGLSRDAYGRLVLGDIIVGIDGKKVTNLDELSYILESHKVGDEVELLVIRNKDLYKVKVKLVAGE